MTGALVTVLLLGFQKAPAKPIVVGELMKSPAKYDKKVVSVTGKILQYQERVAKTSQKPYTVFKLTDGKVTVNVYLRNRPATKVKNGDKATVTGTFALEKKVGNNTFKNEIDASNDKVKTNGVKLAK